MSASITQERRQGPDRRRLSPPPVFPFFDSEQTLVRADRRLQLDRRANNDLYIEDPNSLDARVVTDTPKTANRRLVLWYNETPKEISTASDSLWAGRSPRCELILDNHYISRRHARITYQNGVFALLDQSRNGTYIKEGESESYIVQEQAPLFGSGAISLGVPFDHSDSHVIHYFIS